MTIVGVGLLGGSAGLALKACDPGVHIVGVGRRRASLAQALEAGAIDEACLDPVEPARRTDLVILASPVGAFEKHLHSIAPVLRRGAAVTDVGSTKALVVRAGERILGVGGPFVGSHPMAGSEQRGPGAARGDLFAGATCIVTPTKNTPPSLVRKIEAFWGDLGMRTVRMTPAAHDRAMACVSHLPHVLAALLMMLPKDKDLGVSATGFRDATRLAGGDPEMWRDILITNRREILGALDAMDDSLMQLRDLLALADAPGIEEFLAAAKARRDATVARSLSDRRLALE